MGYGDDEDRRGFDEVEAFEAVGGLLSLALADCDGPALDFIEALERWASE